MPGRHHPVLFSFLGAALLGGACYAAARPAARVAARPAASAPTYERDIKPLFQARCFACHGGGQVRAGLDVSAHGDLLEGGYSGPSIKPGDPKGSLLYQMLADGRMPKGPKLSAAELKKVESWIKAGAKGLGEKRGHWAFRPPVAPPLPMVKGAAPANAIDRFLLSKLQAKGLSYAPPADRRTLLRRVTFDLIGLPPTPAEVEAFLADAALGSYERVVDRLLADPRYGERWARHWLDPAGYADSEGVLQEDRVRSNMWRYRDYVVRSLNADKPYDQFVREQIAGDELVDYRNATEFTPALVDSLTATGFLRTAVDATREDFNAHQFGEYQYRMLHDTQTIVFSTVLGVQIQCARCHNHKFEPITQKDYYQVQSLFMGAVRPRGKVLPTYKRQIVAATAAQQKQAAEVNAAVDATVGKLNEQSAALLREWQLRAMDERLAMVPEADRNRFAAAARAATAPAADAALLKQHPMVYPLAAEALAKAYPEFKSRQADLLRQIATEQKKKIAFDEIRAMYDLDATPPPTPLLHRGEWLKPAEPVEPGIPWLLEQRTGEFKVPPPAAGAATTGRRKALAEWLTQPTNPLTARVLVNRVWAHHFGVGIVPTLDNLGRSGAKPSHPELLDWLAGAFSGQWSVVSGQSGSRQSAVGSQQSVPGLAWSVKALHRLMVTSGAYRQGSANREAAATTVDRENVLLWRYRPRRLEAEAVRDAALAASGMLDATMGGPPVDLQTKATGEIVAAGEEGKGRRSLYLLVRRTTPVNLLNAFDAPVMETNCTRRVTSTTPTQALALLNSPFIGAQAGHFAKRVLEKDATDAAALEQAFQIALSRPPTPTERADSLQFLQRQSERYTAEKATDPRQQAWTDLCQSLLSSNEFAYLD